MIKIISLGLGVQSTALYFMSSTGELPRADLAIFADTGKEKKATYAYLKYLLEWAIKNAGVPIVVIRKRNLYKDLLNKTNSTGQTYRSIPAYVKNEDGEEAMLKRQCTHEYKIKQIEGTIRKFLGVKRVTGQQIQIWKGISLDEWDRMANPRTGWQIFVYPFTGYMTVKGGNKAIDEFPVKKMSRADLLKWYGEHNFPTPVKSSCVFCPFQSDLAWNEMKEKAPEDFAAAVRVDQAIRDSTKKGINQPAFLHRSMQPLDEVIFSKSGDLWSGGCSDNCHL